MIGNIIIAVVFFASGFVAGYGWFRPVTPMRVTVPCLVDGKASETWGQPGFRMMINGQLVECP